MIGGRNPNAWNNGYHAVGSTYGTWLRGDSRGFCTFRHREHVEGDYLHPPPPGVYAPIFEYTRKRLRYPPLQLSPEQRRVLCAGIAEHLQRNGVEVVAVAVAVNHFHLLARFPALAVEERTRYGMSILKDLRDPAPRHYLGLARKYASEQLHAVGLKPESPVWAARPKLDPVRDRPHQVNVAQYIVGHLQQGAVVYDLKRGIVLPASW